MTSFFEFFLSNGNLVVLNLLLQITLLSGIAIILACRYKNKAAVRYGILFPALISLLLLTATSLFLQSRNTSLFYLPMELEQEQLTAGLPDFVFDEPPISILQIEPEIAVSAGLEADSQSMEVKEGPIAFWKLLINLPSYLILMGLWIGGFLFYTLGMLRSFHNIERVSRGSSQLSLSEKQRLDELFNDVLSTKRQLPFRYSDQISSPMLAGLVSPVILLPDNFVSRLDAKQLESVLLHELAHFERNDLTANFLQKIIVTIFWFHPLVHVMDRMIARAREEICDNYVLAKEQPLEYSRALLHVSSLASQCRSESGSRELAVRIFGNNWNLEQRIRELLSESREKSMKLSRGSGRALQLLLITFSLLLASCQFGVAESGDVLADSAGLAVIDKSELRKLQDVEERLQRRTRSLLGQSQLLDQQNQRLAEQSLKAEYQVRQLSTELRELENKLQELTRLSGSGAENEQSLVLQELESRLQNTKRELEQKALLLRDQSERLQREKINLAQRRLSLEDQNELLQQDAREVELEMRAMQEEKEKILLRQEQLKRKFTKPAETSVQVRRRDSPAAYIKVQATSQDQTRSQTQSRPAPAARTAGTLGPRVMRAISEIQEYMQPEDSEVEADLVAAKELLDQLYNSRFERMNDFEKSTTLSFYTNYYLGTENYPEAIRSFEQILAIETLREDVHLRALRSLGQLYAAIEYWEDSIQSYQQWREVSQEEDEVVSRGLSYAHYQLEQFEEALPNWLNYMELVRSSGGELGRDDYAYLNGLYFTLEDFDSALELTKEMILLFNEPADWRNLRAIFAELDDAQGTSELEQELSAELKQFRTDSQIPEQVVRSSNGDYLPLISNDPLYPTRAAQRGIEGWILLGFTVDEQGNVVDDSVRVIDANPPNVFNRSAIRAAVQFKYEPRVRDGKAVAVPDVKYLFRYELNKNA